MQKLNTRDNPKCNIKITDKRQTSLTDFRISINNKQIEEDEPEDETNSDLSCNVNQAPSPKKQYRSITYVNKLFSKNVKVINL